jgi:hypothetical protein
VRWWRVTFRGALSDEVVSALRVPGIIHVGGHARYNAAGDVIEQSNTALVTAHDGFKAIHQIRAALNGLGVFSDFKADEFKFLVYFGVPIEEAGTLDLVRDEDPRIRQVSAWSPTHDEAEILFELSATDADDALTQARTSYADLRRRAHLLPAEPLYAMVNSTDDALTAAFTPVGSDTAFFRHVKKARDLFDVGDYDLAVVVAQTSCEVLTQAAITQLIGDPVEGEPTSARVLRSWWQTRVQPCAMTADDRVRELWNALAGEEIQQQAAWWKDYKDHTSRRHGIVHRGATVTREDAEHSLKATEAFRDYILATFVRLRRDGL